MIFSSQDFDRSNFFCVASSLIGVYYSRFAPGCEAQARVWQ
jgi:hypothetical protein